MSYQKVIRPQWPNCRNPSMQWVAKYDHNDQTVKIPECNEMTNKTQWPNCWIPECNDKLNHKWPITHTVEIPACNKTISDQCR